ncbi:MAG: hypothetical protein K5986_02195 [Clostridium sp.]|uniref:hypothetical protein n=1 Tax=Clostridium sp. DSM 8431 TaxID=1761781 RepID=UPI0008F3D591|nr:hypothetical protein [Clostridium sp. DSM 8431]MCR4943274.1 hypothetical protein [Clostridium sp.]SFU39416.1 hypothetical protein SAMN04487886_101818 [Clostridium sp. DSM 8431]
MSKHKDKRGCCCKCCDSCCCSSGYMNNYGGFGNIFGGSGCGFWEAILFWLIACGAGLLNTNSILIILLFLLYGWCGDNGCQNSFGW